MKEDYINPTIHGLVGWRILRTRYQYSIEKPQNKYSTP
jgi:hypothetical protein